jgi:hypothetical protein
MERRPIWHATKMVAVGVAIMVTLTAPTGVFPGSGVSIVEAGIAQGKDDD